MAGFFATELRLEFAQSLLGKRVTGALLLIALPFKKQTSQRMRSMSTSPVFRPDCKDQLLLPEQDPVGFAQRLTGIIGTRSLGSSPIQLENLQPFARAQPLDGAETNIISANEKSREGPSRSHRFALQGGGSKSAFSHERYIPARDSPLRRQRAPGQRPFGSGGGVHRLRIRRALSEFLTATADSTATCGEKLYISAVAFMAGRSSCPAQPIP